MTKKAQSGKEVAVIILLLALFMVLYILLLPPADRDALLNNTASSSSSFQAKTYLSESPGEVFSSKDAKIMHDIESMNIFFKTEPTTNNLASSLAITKNVFTENSQTLSFKLESLTNLKSATLFFKVKAHSGDLEIRLNNNLIFLDEIKDGEIKSISLPTNQMSKDNIIVFKASSPGIAFWSTNKYVLEDINLKENFEMINPKEERIFSVPSSEYSNLKKSTLTYMLYCNSLDGDNTRLKVYLNKDEVFSGIVDCSSGSSSLEIPIKYFKEDQNSLTYVIEKGDFTITNLKLTNELKEKSYISYNFDIDSSDYNLVASGERDLILKLTFPNTNLKRGKILINNKEISMETSEKTFIQEISSSANSGSNIIKLVPSNTFTVDNLKITLE